jgi:hypothetical protein
VTYRIGFSNKPTWSKGGYTLEASLDLKTYFIERVPCARWGEVEPE